MPQQSTKPSAKSNDDKKLALISASAFSKALQGIKLTPKQRKWLRVYLETGNYTEAARQAYNCKTNDSAWSMGYYNLRRLEIPIKNLMDLAGLSDAAIMRTVQDGLKATKVVVATHEGNITDEKTYVDYPTRKQYAELALKTKGHLKEQIQLEAVIHDPGDYDGTDPLSYIEACLSGREKSRNEEV